MIGPFFSQTALLPINYGPDNDEDDTCSNLDEEEDDTVNRESLQRGLGTTEKGM